jgi:hypothetical protein
MSGILRLEFQRAFKNQRLWLIPALALAGLWLGYKQFPPDFVVEGATQNASRIWILWYSYTFFIYLAPLLAAIPYSDSLLTDRRYGFLKNIITRCRFSHYMAAKILANMAVGALAVSLPVALNIIYCFLVVKVKGPILTIGTSSFTTFPIAPMGALGYLYGPHPWQYLAFLIALAGFFGAAYATFGLAVSTWVNNTYVTMAAPFAYLVVMGYLAERSLKLAIIGHPAGAFLPFRFGLSGLQITGQYLILSLAFMFSFAVYARRARNQRLA